MAGRLVFDQAASPNAAIVNQGTLTIADAGLAALVAPQVANSGVITATLGHVVLAGAKTATLDLYGDGMLSLDVNNEVTQAPLGPNGAAVTALVTNTGVIRADGGTVQLTARQADGLVQDLVDAGGKIIANSATTSSGGSQTGTVVLGGLGGSIVLSGVVTADGNAPGSTGGQVQANASQGVTLTPTAQISASGPAGGGTVAVGTTLARAAGGPGTASRLTAQTVQVDPGASIAANATADGNGGRVTVLSVQSTSMDGAISAQGGPQGGNGGFVETSGNNLSIATGAVNVSAPLGALGTILLDPAILTITSTAPGSLDSTFNATGTIRIGTDPGGTDTVSTEALDAFKGNVLLQAAETLTVAEAFSLTAGGPAPQSLTLEAGGTITVQASITASGNIILATGGAGPDTPPPALTGPLIAVVDGAAVTSTGGSVSLLAGRGGKVELGTPGFQARGTTGTLTAASGQLVTLQMDTLAINNASSITAPNGAIEIAPATPNTAVTLMGAGGLSITALELGHMSTGTLRIGAATISGTPTTTASSITVAGTVDLPAAVATTLELDATGPVSEPGGSLAVETLTGNSGPVTLTDTNTVATLGNYTVNGAGNGFQLDNGSNLLLSGTLDATDIALFAPGYVVTLGNGAAIVTGGTTPTGPGPLDPAREPAFGAPGAYIQAASFSQIGSSSLSGQGGGPATLQISTTGTAQFDPPFGLQANNGWLILNLGAGTAAGSVYVNALNVTYSGPGGADLFGAVGGITGPAAAAFGFNQPAINPSYTFNGCEIGTLACTVGTSVWVPPIFLSAGGMLPPPIGLPPFVLLAEPLLPPPACALPGPGAAPPGGSGCALTDPDVVPPNVSYVDY